MVRVERARVAIQTAAAWLAQHRVAAALLGVIVFVAVPQLARWGHGGAFAQGPPQQTPSIQNSGPCANFAPNYGTMNCGTINLGPIPPEVKIVVVKPIEKSDDGNFKQQVVVRLTGEYSPPKLVLAMKGENILKVVPDAHYDGVMSTSEGTQGDIHWVAIQNAVPAEYILTAATKTSAPVTFFAQLR
jgi:hypothetical protein